MTVLLAEFAKALLGEIAKEVWKDLGNRIRKLRAGGTVEFVYRGRTAQNVLVDIVLTYPSARAMRADVHNHQTYVAMAAAWVAVDAPKAHESRSLAKLIEAASGGPQDLVVRRSPG